jgi:hypothetical protein
MERSRFLVLDNFAPCKIRDRLLFIASEMEMILFRTMMSEASEMSCAYDGTIIVGWAL